MTKGWRVRLFQIIAETAKSEISLLKYGLKTGGFLKRVQPAG